MQKFPSRFKDLELQTLLDGEVIFPKGINEFEFFRDISENSKLNWRINHRFISKQCLALLIDATALKKWGRLRLLFLWTFVLLFAACIWLNSYQHWIFLIFYLILSTSVKHRNFIFTLALLLTVIFCAHIHVPSLPIYCIITTIGYLINRIRYELIERQILGNALKDWKLFWKFYTARIIVLEGSFLSPEYITIKEKYPELKLNNVLD